MAKIPGGGIVKTLRYRSIWISDIHLGTKHANSRFLLDFLKKTQSEYLYLVGDIIDFWKLETGGHWPHINNHIIRNILKKVRAGTKVVYIPGNHDEIIRRFTGTSIRGIKVQNESIHTTIDGSRFLVTHGDEFDCVVQKNRWLAKLGSFAYDVLLEINTVNNFFRSKLGLPYKSISAYLKSKVKKVVNFVSRYEETVVSEARKRQVDGFICGHIHQPASKNLKGIVYKNIGDWVESCSALIECFDGSLQIVYWTDTATQSTVWEIAYGNSYGINGLVPSGWQS
jgi:UDP-2,3-diacylglucosamine pyrophosphatase LpxH